MLGKIRDYLWSEACSHDVVAYKAYLVAAENGLRLIAAGDVDGAAKLIGSECRCFDNDLGVEPAVVVSSVAGSDEVVDISTGVNHSVGSEDHVDCGVGTSGLVVSGGGFPVDSIGDSKCCRVGGRDDEGLSGSRSCEFNTASDGRPVGSVLESGVVSGVVMNARGPNFLRNHANRLAKKRRKQNRRDEVSQDNVQGKSGFWNSCSDSVRQELIDSKAKMHIAENLRKAKESEHRVLDMESPFSLVQKVVKMAEFAQKQAEKNNDSRVYGWAQTVATVSAESLANSVPSSVPSLSEIKEVSSCTSPSETVLLAKIDSLELENNTLRDKVSSVEKLERVNENLRKVNQRLEDESLELAVEKEIAKTQVNQVTSRSKLTKMKPEIIGGVERTLSNYANFPGLKVNNNLKFERFDPKKHKVLTRAEVYEEYD